jgi:hypothetical protein
MVNYNMMIALRAADLDGYSDIYYNNKPIAVCYLHSGDEIMLMPWSYDIHPSAERAVCTSDAYLLGGQWHIDVKDYYGSHTLTYKSIDVMTGEYTPTPGRFGLIPTTKPQRVLVSNRIHK